MTNAAADSHSMVRSPQVQLARLAASVDLYKAYKSIFASPWAKAGHAFWKHVTGTARPGIAASFERRMELEAPSVFACRHQAAKGVAAGVPDNEWLASLSLLERQLLASWLYWTLASDAGVKNGVSLVKIAEHGFGDSNSQRMRRLILPTTFACPCPCCNREGEATLRTLMFQSNYGEVSFLCKQCGHQDFLRAAHETDLKFAPSLICRCETCFSDRLAAMASVADASMGWFARIQGEVHQLRLLETCLDRRDEMRMPSPASERIDSFLEAVRNGESLMNAGERFFGSASQEDRIWGKPWIAYMVDNNLLEREEVDAKDGAYEVTLRADIAKGLHLAEPIERWVAALQSQDVETFAEAADKISRLHEWQSPWIRLPARYRVDVPSRESSTNTGQPVSVEYLDAQVAAVKPAWAHAVAGALRDLKQPSTAENPRAIALAVVPGARDAHAAALHAQLVALSPSLPEDALRFVNEKESSPLPTPLESRDACRLAAAYLYWAHATDFLGDAGLWPGHIEYAFDLKVSDALEAHPLQGVYRCPRCDAQSSVTLRGRALAKGKFSAMLSFACSHCGHRETIHSSTAAITMLYENDCLDCSCDGCTKWRATRRRQHSALSKTLLGSIALDIRDRSSSLRAGQRASWWFGGDLAPHPVRRSYEAARTASRDPGSLPLRPLEQIECMFSGSSRHSKESHILAAVTELREAGIISCEIEELAGFDDDLALVKHALSGHKLGLTAKNLDELLSNGFAPDDDAGWLAWQRLASRLVDIADCQQNLRLPLRYAVSDMAPTLPQTTSPQEPRKTTVQPVHATAEESAVALLKGLGYVVIKGGTVA